MNLYENYWMDEEDDVRVTNISKRLTQGEKEMFDVAERHKMEVLTRYKKKEENANEKIRENIVKEREETLVRFQFFKDYTGQKYI